MHPARASVAVIGGSGLYDLFEGAVDVAVDTPFGPPSAPLAVGALGGTRVAFLARHGRRHTLPPHRVDYRANLWALASVGVRSVIATSAVGGLSQAAAPGVLVVPDQLIDRTWGRADTFFDGPEVEHVPLADPFCPVLREAAISALTEIGERHLPTGTTAVIQGPRFSTRAESGWLRSIGADIVNMTQYPEAPLAAELGLGYVNLSLVTDSDAGTAAVGADGEGAAVTAEVVMRRLAEAKPRLVAAVTAVAGRIPEDYPGRMLLSPEAVERILSLSPAGGPA